MRSATTGDRTRRRGAVACTVAGLLLFVGVACNAEEPASDELYDFVEPSTSEIGGGTPYDSYVVIVEQSGGQPMAFGDAEQRAATICEAPAQSATSGDDLVTDTALMRAYCPDVALDGGG